MKNKIFLSFLASALIMSSVVSADTTEEELSNVKQELELLKEELNLIKSNISSNEQINNEFLNSLSKTNEDIIDMDERIDDVEAVALTDKLSFGIEMRNVVDGGSVKYTDGTKKSKWGSGWSRVRLNMHHNITNNMEFFGRMSMMKNWGTSNINIPLYDHQEGRRPSTSSLFIERAYVEWNAIDGDIPIQFLIGRLPTGDGPSLQFKDNTVRKAMVSSMAFDGDSDGGQISFNTSKVLNLPESQIRLAYGKIFQNDAFLQYNFPKINDTDIVGSFFTTHLSEDSDSTFNFSYMRAFNIINNYGEDVGDLDISYVYLEFPNLYNSGWSFFAHAGTSIARPSGEVVFGDTLNGVAGSSTEKQIGYAAWLGARYKFESPSLHNPRIGFEYNYGSEKWTNFTSGFSDSINKFSVRGNSYDIYYSQPINSYSFFRLGFQLLESTHSGDASNLFSKTGSLGISGPEQKTVNRAYFTFNVKF